MAAVSTDKGVRSDGCIEVGVILPCEVECGRECEFNVARGAELTADDDAVVLASPRGSSLGGEPVSGKMQPGLAQWDILREINKQASKAISDIPVPMSQGNVALYGPSDLFSIEAAIFCPSLVEGSCHSGHGSETADVLVFDATLPETFAQGIDHPSKSGPFNRPIPLEEQTPVS